MHKETVEDMNRVSATALRFCNCLSKSNDSFILIFTQNFITRSQPSSHNSQTDQTSKPPSNVSSFDRDRYGGSVFIRLEEKPNVHRDHPSMDEYSSDVEKVYRILRKFHTRIPKLDLALQESGVTVSSGLVERVLNRCGDAGHLGYRFFAWASKQPGYRPNYQVYKSIIKILGKMKQFGEVWALIEEMRKENPELLTCDAFVVLMRRFASARVVNKAIEILDETPKYGCDNDTDEHVFGCLLDALCKNGSVKEAASLFEEMRIRFAPNLSHFTLLLNGWCKEGRLMEAKFALVQMREAGFEPDIVVYNNLLSGYALAGKMQDAFNLLHEMKKKECEPNATSYTTLIQALCSKDKLEEAMQVFGDLKKNDCVADVVTYTTLISGFCKLGNIDKGYELLDDMIQRCCTPNQLTYLHVMLAHEKKDQLEECLELLEEMQKIDCIPDLNIYNTVIRLCCKLGKVDKGVCVWNQMETCGHSPGLDTYTIMINGFLGQCHLIKACKYFKEMVTRDLLSAPRYGNLKELMNSLLRAEKLEMAEDVWSRIVSKGCDINVYAWTIWIHALFKNRYVKEACSYCLDMMDANVMPQPDTFAKLIKGLKKLYNREIAVEITDKVRKIAADRQISFKMYKRRGERDLKAKVKAKGVERKRAARQHQWGKGQGRGKIV